MNGGVLRRTYQEVSDRAKGLAYYLRKHKYTKVGILCPNTPAFLESIFGIAGAGAVNVGMGNKTSIILRGCAEDFYPPSRELSVEA